jgi:acyl-[acyl-carrier-protein]-phospholipid O-acyltransferase/long-chain-fatty-acid--[acyl-carrier-protein] ligase
MLLAFLRFLVRLFYGFRALNEQALQTPGPVLLLPNHVSWWDWLLVGVCLERDWRFVTSLESAELSWIHKKIMVNRRTFPVDMNSPYAVKHMADYLQKGGRLVLFPEGRLSVTGSLMKLYDGTGFLIYKTGAKVITAYLRGARRLPFSRNPEKKLWFPRLSVHFSEVLQPPKSGYGSTSEARSRLTHWLHTQMVGQQFETEMQFGAATLPAAILETARLHRNKIILQDATMKELTYRRLILSASLLAKQWNKTLSPDVQRIGVLLPNVNGMPVTLLSLWLANRVPSILNYSSGVPVMLTCARLAGLKQIVTSKSFVERSKLDLHLFKEAGIEFLFVEDVSARITGWEKFSQALRQFFNLQPSSFNFQPSDTALVLFTSGSEGEPKGVELTHRNVLANIRQLLAVIDLMEIDRVFNALPLFHSFGMTGLLLPLVRGIFTFLYLSPLHYRVIPSAFYNLNCTLFFGTNTFLAGYARKAHPYDFHTMRYLIAGAEKLHESTQATWLHKFGKRILEGYGATECSPVLAVNLPMNPRQGSVGQFLPGIEYRLEPVPGLDNGEIKKNEEVGRLFVRGPNIMRGYLNPEANAKFKALGGWYDTGDIAKADSEGYVFIQGRLKRFAKISGEMVSLTAVEDALAGAFPQFGPRFAAAVIAKPDEGKGEKLIAVSNESKLSLDQVREAIRKRGLGNLAVPRELKVIHTLPRLGSGKINHRELEKMVSEKSELGSSGLAVL